MDSNNKITNRLIIPHNPDWEDSGAEKELFKNLTDENIELAGEELEKRELEKQKLLEEEKKEEEERKKIEEEEKRLKLMWNTKAILNDLKKYHVITEENEEMMWYKWKIVRIDLPAVWNFKWFKFEYFVSDKRVKDVDFQLDSELTMKSFYRDDICKLLQAMNEYMRELGGKNDINMNYEYKLKFWSAVLYKCYAWDYLKAIIWLNSVYWLRDRNLNRRSVWNCSGISYFGLLNRVAPDDTINARGYLLLKLSG